MDEIPNEIIVHILNYLATDELINARAVSSQWRDFIPKSNK